MVLKIKYILEDDVCTTLINPLLSQSAFLQESSIYLVSEKNLWPHIVDTLALRFHMVARPNSSLRNQFYFHLCIYLISYRLHSLSHFCFFFILRNIMLYLFRILHVYHLVLFLPSLQHIPPEYCVALQMTHELDEFI